uniref:Serine protease 53 n=1 Tax=Ornithorhynchus anatinus TaxID=9258 RepID=F6ZJP1_ORNAN
MERTWTPDLLVLTALVLPLGLQATQQDCGQRGLGFPEPQEGASTQGEWPWQASVRHRGTHICSGSLIAEAWVLTAAHCFDRLSVADPDSWSVVLGSLLRDGVGPGAKEAAVVSIQLPGGYNRYTEGSDLALLQLAPAGLPDGAASPICLPQLGHRFPFGASCWATGWGQGTGRAPGTLRNLRLRLISRPTCNCLYNRLHLRALSSPARPGMLCAGAQPGVRGPCQGDSGGPVLCQEPDGRWVQAGIISFSTGCAQEDAPVLLTNLASHAYWLRARAQGATFLSQGPDVPESHDEDSCVACGSLKGEGPHPGAPSSWPWDARLWHQGQLVCGGALVSEEVVLTAAHCFIGRQSLEQWRVRLGMAVGEEERGLQRLTLHGAYTHPAGGHDLALLVLSQPVVLGPTLRPLCLPYASHRLPEGGRGWALGRVPHGAGFDWPQAVPVTILGHLACNRLDAAPGGQGGPILPEMVCGSALEEMPRCEALSGAPLVHEVRGTWFLAGLHSFGNSCGGPTGPGVFTSASAHEDWVSGLAWQVYFAEEPEPEGGSCPANISMDPSWSLQPLISPATPEPAVPRSKLH